MKWIKRNPSLSSIAGVVQGNVGMRLDTFLHPDPHPHLEGLSGAVQLVRGFILGHPKSGIIYIVGDYDADGVTSSAILSLALRHCGALPSVHIPRRFSDGYGISMGIVDHILQLAGSKPVLVITVDNGISASTQIGRLVSAGLDVVVLDHHLLPEGGSLPPGSAIVDPAALPGSCFTSYCGAGLALRFSEELLAVCGVDDPSLLQGLYALAAVGTVADVMPLTGANRYIVQRGLDTVTHREVTSGFRALLDALGLESVQADDFGFQVGPCINASGRLYDDGGDFAYRLLSLEEGSSPFLGHGTSTTAAQMASILVQRNQERQDLTRAQLAAVEAVISSECLAGTNPLVVYHPGLHEGIVGILAGSLAEKYHVPVLVFTDGSMAGTAKGSGRSYGGIHLKHLLDTVSGLFLQYGGHAGAAGMSIRVEQIHELRDALSGAVPQIGPGGQMCYDLEIDAPLVPAASLALEPYAPYGEGNPAPVFYIRDFPVDSVQILGHGGQHVKWSGPYGEALGFGLATRWESSGITVPSCLDILGRISRRMFRGVVRVQVEVVDFKKGGPKHG